MKKLRLLFIILFTLTATVFADEGMWMLSQLKQLDLNKKGLELKPNEVYSAEKTSITDAIVWLGGCSASFVSDQGLLLTNHHCAYGALQRNASKSGHDYIKEGFLAKDRSEELPAMGSNAYVLQEIQDVSAEILSSVKKISDPVKRDKIVQEKMAAMKNKIEGDREDISARVASMFKGKQYWLFIYKKYQDVRIVFAPPASIGKYGGDVDNWMWPRHTGDFTYMRVYMAPDGSGAKYSPDNIPVKPKNYLRISQTPLKEGDFNFIIGFPGSTTRWHTSYSVQWNLQHKFKERIKEFSEVLSMMDDFGEKDAQAKIKLAGFHAGLANAMKNYQGNVDGMERTHFIDQKRAFESDLMQFINKNSGLKEKYAHVLPDIAKQYQNLEATYQRDAAIGNFGFLSGTMASLASQVYGTAREREKPESEREPEFSERKVKQGAERLKYRFLSFYEPFDKAMFLRALEKVQNLPADQKIIPLETILKKKDLKTFVEKAYAKTKLKDPAFAKDLFYKSTKELMALNDPFIQLAASLYDLNQQIKEEKKSFNAHIDELRRAYIDALYAWKGEGLYPDANGTVRFTYGYIKGYQPRDAVWYRPFTTLNGVVEKDSGMEPFDMPAKLGQLETAKDFGRWEDKALQDVPVAFLNTCDITGGNSGSAVMNAKGELIGLAFDGNYEAMTGDWQFDDSIQRTIAVDIRYVLFLTEKYAGANYLLKEMGF